MSGFFQAMKSLVGISRSPAAFDPKNKGLMYRRAHLREAFLTALLSLTVLSIGTRVWAQEEGEDTSQDETSLRKKAPAKPVPEATPVPKEITFTTRLDRTAIYVGDQFHYMIIVDYTPAYEFVLDNLTKETVNMDPFQVMDVGKKTVTLKNNNRTLFVDLTLANFGAGQTSLQVPQFTLYYFRKDKKTTTAEQAAAESLTVPGPVIGLRSTLPPQPADIRDAITVNGWERIRWILPIAGYLCGAVLLVGVVWEGAVFIKKQRSRKGPDRRKAMEAVRARWISGVPSNFNDPKTCIDFYNHSYQNLKEYIGYYLETETMGLTADELQEEMRRLSASPDLTQRVGKVLDSCEVLRYRRDGVTADPEAARNIAQDMREILSAKRS